MQTGTLDHQAEAGCKRGPCQVPAVNSQEVCIFVLATLLFYPPSKDPSPGVGMKVILYQPSAIYLMMTFKPSIEPS